MGARVLLGLILLAGAILRLALLLGPYSEIDADEAIVGLMALNIRELPVFYWDQYYLGSLEAFAAAGVFALIGPSDAALKSVPAVFSLVFTALVYVSARRAFGVGPALLAALYLAIPPSFFALWSVKARGGYAELLMLGQLFLFLCQVLADATNPRRWLAAMAGIAAGLALWTHPLALVYLAAGGTFLILAQRARRAAVGPKLVPAAAGFAAGLLPAILFNILNGFPSLRYVAAGGTAPGSAVLNLWGLARYGAPVLAGLAEGTASKVLLDADWPRRPGSIALVAGLLWVVVFFVVWSHRRALADLVRRAGQPCDLQAAPLLLVVLFIPVFVAVSRFADLWAEPRYALPAYSAVPLLTALVWRLRKRSRPLFAGVVAVLVSINAFSLLTSDPRLALPTSIGDSNQANRAELIDYLSAHGLNRIYTDYWLAYPLAFESHERIIPAVRSGGFNRRDAYSHQVFVSPDPAFVFPTDTRGDLEFGRDLAALSGSASVTQVSVYRVYTDVRPLDELRVKS